MNEFQPDAAQLAAAAETLKVLAHPVRLCIVAGLYRRGGCIVGEMQDCLGLSQAAVSQHLAKLRTAGVVRATREGNQVRYELASPLAKELAAILTER